MERGRNRTDRERRTGAATATTERRDVEDWRRFHRGHEIREQIRIAVFGDRGALEGYERAKRAATTTTDFSRWVTLTTIRAIGAARTPIRAIGAARTPIRAIGTARTPIRAIGAARTA